MVLAEQGYRISLPPMHTTRITSRRLYSIVLGSLEDISACLKAHDKSVSTTSIAVVALPTDDMFRSSPADTEPHSISCPNGSRVLHFSLSLSTRRLHVSCPSFLTSSTQWFRRLEYVLIRSSASSSWH